MTRLAPILLAAVLTATSAAAQDDTLPAPAPEAPPQSELREGMDLFAEGTRLLLQGLLGELEPSLRELEEALNDLTAYHPPEVLPNGDILIRRKTPLQLEPQVGEDGEVDL